MPALPSIRADELRLGIELAERLKSAISYRTYHSDAVPGLSDLLSNWLADAEKELRQVDDDAAHLALWRRQANGRRGSAA